MAKMKRVMYREDLAHLDRSLAFEREPARCQILARRLKYEVDELEAAEMKTITPRQAYSANYWKARAARLRQASGLYQSQAVQDYLFQVAAGYDSLAERAHKVQKSAEQASVGRDYEAKSNRFSLRDMSQLGAETFVSGGPGVES